MATVISPADKAVVVCFKESETILSYSVVSMRAEYSNFLVVLHDLTKSHAHNIRDLAFIKEPGEGLSLTDGAWWYTIVVPADRQESGEKEVATSDWQILDCAEDYEDLMTNLSKRNGTPEVRIEFQHQLQKDRDELRAPTRRRLPLIVGGLQPKPRQPPSPTSTPQPPRQGKKDERHTLRKAKHGRSGRFSSSVTNPYENVGKGACDLSTQTNPCANESTIGLLHSMTGDPDPSILTPRDFVMRRFELNDDDFQRNLDPALEINQK